MNYRIAFYVVSSINGLIAIAVFSTLLFPYLIAAEIVREFVFLYGQYFVPFLIAMILAHIYTALKSGLGFDGGF